MCLQLNFDEILESDYLTQALIFLAGVMIKNELVLEKVELTQLF